MTSSRFGRYELLTTDMPAARTFYAEVLGADFWGEDFTLSVLPDQARARGAKPHFRGHLGVADVEGTLQRLVADGGMQLGPLRSDTKGKRVGVRDPFGANFSLTSEVLPLPRPLVGWHLMTTTRHETAFDRYAELFGWGATVSVDFGDQRGRHQLFSWDESGLSVGSVSDLARQPHIHPQWLFYFRVTDLERSAARVRELGGLALPSSSGVGDALMAACDDPQSGAFGLWQA